MFLKIVLCEMFSMLKISNKKKSEKWSCVLLQKVLQQKHAFAL